MHSRYPHLATLGAGRNVRRWIEVTDPTAEPTTLMHSLRCECALNDAGEVTATGRDHILAAVTSAPARSKSESCVV